ncbi:hypothetical protein RIF29_30230 [Crotalaria pallida]|uniref:Isopenicillin N synthase-like Fe(2+) 2OG dioxygenase domain-containing protein n=1 Tax=Crotalaria pallida TaxID=3830 RepID=A0AAN9HWW5_CROPI
MEIWSNGKYKSIEHRAVINKNKERNTHVIFLSPMYDAEVEPLIMGEQNCKLYKKIRYDDYLKDSFNKKFEGKAHIDKAKIKE